MAKRSVKLPMTRSENMSRIRSKNTTIEVLLGKAMWHLGLRYRKHDKTVFGKPDFVFKRKKIAVFCDSEFWHGKYLMEGKYIPKTNAIFWISKLKKNIQRDTDVNAFLQIEGWTVVRFWEEDIRKDSERCALKVKLLVKMI
jgi:DNA mismatch endonuclease (patch repair protein)